MDGMPGYFEHQEALVKNWELFLNLTKMQWGHEGVKHIFFAYILAVF